MTDEIEVQAIVCLSCGAADAVRSTDERAVRWPAWNPGPLFGFCPRCGGDAWAAEPITEDEYARGHREHHLPTCDKYGMVDDDDVPPQGDIYIPHVCDCGFDAVQQAAARVIEET